MTIEFIQKRIREQNEYLALLDHNFEKGFMSLMRYNELKDSANKVKFRFIAKETEYKEYWLAEMEKCKADPVYFFANYVLINGKKPTEWQVERFKTVLALMLIQPDKPVHPKFYETSLKEKFKGTTLIVGNGGESIDSADRFKKIWMESNPELYQSRCCGRCDGINDECVSDMICEKHNKQGCEICYGQRESISKNLDASGNPVEYPEPKWHVNPIVDVPKEPLKPYTEYPMISRLAVIAEHAWGTKF